MNERKVPVWDLPLRLFHWLLVLAMGAAIVTGQLGGNLMDWHGRIGLGIVGLLAFRIVWGLVGSTHARFSGFFPTPARVRAYLCGEWHGEGHNPLGAFSVFGMLGLIAFQLATGLCANDDIAFSGPLRDAVGDAWSDRLTGWHHLAANLLIGLIGLHIAAILFYAHVKKNNLVRPMVRGWKEIPPGKPLPEAPRGGHWLAVVFALALAALAVHGASGAWLPAPPPPPPPAATPAW